MSDLYLIHHGIKGQRWGIRRYQNYDGTLIKSNKGIKKANAVFKKAFEKSDKSNVNSFNSKNGEGEKRGKEIDNLYLKSIADVKKADPNIGVVARMSNGRAESSSNIQKSLDEGNHILRVDWICYGSTLAQTLNMIETSVKYGNEKGIKEKVDAFYNEYRKNYLKDIGLDATDAGVEYLKKIGISA